MRGRVAGTVLVCLGATLLVGAAVGGGVAADAGGWSGAGGPDADPADESGGGPSAGGADEGRPADPPTDNTVTRILVRPDGDAVWRVKVRTRLTEDRVDEFEAFQRRVRGNASRFLGDFRRRMTPVVDNAADETGRSMSAGEFGISTDVQEVPRRWGVVTYEFVWRNLARTEGDRLVVGDVFQGGFFLAANDTLEVRAPDGYRIVAAEPDPDERERDADVVAWDGQEDFAHTRPRVEMAPTTTTASRTTAGQESPTPTDGGTASPTTTAGADADDGSGSDGDDGDGGGSGSPFLLLGGVVLVALSVAGGYVYLSGSAAPAGIARDGEGDDGEKGDARGDDGGAGEDGDAPGTGGPAGVGPAGIVTDEDRVLALLDERSGQMKQATVADELDWSSSKTSRTLSDMADEGTIEKIRIGRENVIRIPPEDDEDGGGDRGWGDA